MPKGPVKGTMAAVSERDIAPHAGRFMAMLDEAFRRYGVSDGLPPRMRAAVTATPRHRYVHRFRIGDGPLQDFDAQPQQTLSDVYSDKVMRHVNASGELLPSSNSQPSYVLWLLHLLGLETGQAVLEIGSGSGWLAAIMGQLVGPAGRIVGIELLPDLAERSRADLAGVGNVEIVTGDGALGYEAGAPYDRAMITAGTWDLPKVLFDQVADGGRVLVPVELRDGGSCEVTVLRRQQRILVAEQAVPGWFVPLLGPGQQDRRSPQRSLQSLSFWTDVRGAPTVRHPLPLGPLPGEAPAGIAAQFRAFLGRTEPGLTTFTTEADAQWTPWRPAPGVGRPILPFGLVDEAARSVAVWNAGELIGYGSNAASVRLAQAYARWAEAGLPGVGAFGLQVHCADAAPASSDSRWIELRGATALAWQLGPDAASWRGLLGWRRNSGGIGVGEHGRPGRKDCSFAYSKIFGWRVRRRGRPGHGAGQRGGPDATVVRSAQGREDTRNRHLRRAQDGLRDEHAADQRPSGPAAKTGRARPTRGCSLRCAQLDQRHLPGLALSGDSRRLHSARPRLRTWWRSTRSSRTAACTGSCRSPLPSDAAPARWTVDGFGLLSSRWPGAGRRSAAARRISRRSPSACRRRDNWPAGR